MGGETKKGEGGRRSERKEEREAGDGESNKISSNLSSAEPLCSILFPLFCRWQCGVFFYIILYYFILFFCLLEHFLKINNKWVYRIFKTYFYAFVKMQKHKFGRLQSTWDLYVSVLLVNKIQKSILNKITTRKLRRSPGACH